MQVYGPGIDLEPSFEIQNFRPRAPHIECMGCLVLDYVNYYMYVACIGLFVIVVNPLGGGGHHSQVWRYNLKINAPLT
jgi:hypothetical protein